MTAKTMEEEKDVNQSVIFVGNVEVGRDEIRWTGPGPAQPGLGPNIIFFRKLLFAPPTSHKNELLVYRRKKT
jgi:hypothetical protein